MAKKTKRWSRSMVLCGIVRWEYHMGNCHYYNTPSNKPSWYKTDCASPLEGLHSSMNNGYIFTHIVGCHPAPALFGAE